VATRPWKALYTIALQSEANSFLDAHRIAVDAILQRMIFLAYEDMSLTVAKTRERRALYVALSDLRVLRAAFRAG